MDGIHHSCITGGGAPKFGPVGVYDGALPCTAVPTARQLSKPQRAVSSPLWLLVLYWLEVPRCRWVIILCSESCCSAKGFALLLSGESGRHWRKRERLHIRHRSRKGKFIIGAIDDSTAASETRFCGLMAKRRLDQKPFVCCSQKPRASRPRCLM